MNPGRVSTHVRNRSASVRVRAARVKTLARFVLKAEKFQIPAAGATLNVLLCDDKFITAMNKQYFGKERPTDVISFPGAADIREAAAENGDAEFHIGDICISLETAVRQHREWDTTLDEEIALYVIHGVLHLLGHEDIKPADYRRMQDRQNAILLSIMHSDRDRATLDLVV